MNTKESQLSENNKLLRASVIVTSLKQRIHNEIKTRCEQSGSEKLKEWLPQELQSTVGKGWQGLEEVGWKDLSQVVTGYEWMRQYNVQNDEEFFLFGVISSVIPLNPAMDDDSVLALFDLLRRTTRIRLRSWICASAGISSAKLKELTEELSYLTLSVPLSDSPCLTVRQPLSVQQERERKELCKSRFSMAQQVALFLLPQQAREEDTTGKVLQTVAPLALVCSTSSEKKTSKKQTGRNREQDSCSSTSSTTTTATEAMPQGEARTQKKVENKATNSVQLAFQSVVQHLGQRQTQFTDEQLRQLRDVVKEALQEERDLKKKEKLKEKKKEGPQPFTDLQPCEVEAGLKEEERLRKTGVWKRLKMDEKRINFQVLSLSQNIYLLTPF